MQVTIARNQKLFDIFSKFLSKKIFLMQITYSLFTWLLHCQHLNLVLHYKNIILYGLVLTRSSVMRYSMDLLPDTQNCGLRMLRKCRKRFPRHKLQRKPLDSDPGMHPWCMTGSLTRGGGENIPGACATRNFAYLVRGPNITAVAKVNRRSVYKIAPHAPPSRAVTMCIFCETDTEAILNIVYEFHPAPKLSPVEKCLNQYSA